MDDPAPSSVNDPAPAPVTLRKQWVTIAVFGAFIVMAEVMSYFWDPAEFRQGKRNVFSVVAGLLWWLGHGLWLSMDRRRRGLEMGAWRYAVVLLTPLTIWIYLVLEYRARAAYLIPLSLAIYVLVGAMVVVILGVAGVLEV